MTRHLLSEFETTALLTPSFLVELGQTKQKLRLPSDFFRISSSLETEFVRFTDSLIRQFTDSLPELGRLIRPHRSSRNAARFTAEKPLPDLQSGRLSPAP